MIYKDTDRDGVPNRFDCQPMNKFKQDDEIDNYDGDKEDSEKYILYNLKTKTFDGPFSNYEFEKKYGEELIYSYDIHYEIDDVNIFDISFWDYIVAMGTDINKVKNILNKYINSDKSTFEQYMQ